MEKEEKVLNLRDKCPDNPYKKVIEEINFQFEHGSSIKKSYEARMLHHLIEIFGEQDFNESIKGLFDYIKSESGTFGEFFFRFHKSLRQTDNMYAVKTWYTDDRTPEEIEEQKILKELLPKVDNSKIRISKKKSIEQGYEQDLKRYVQLNNKSRVEHEEHIGGNLDMLLWNLIQISDMPEQVFQAVFSDDDFGTF
jgi:hypothetical protein